MSHEELSPAKGKGNLWTEEEKMGLLLRVIIQLSASGSIRWKEIQMPGRTAKSIEGQWTKVKTAMNEIKESMGLPVEAKPTPKRSPSKRKADVKLEADEDIFDNLSTPTKKKQQKKQKLDTNSEPDTERVVDETDAVKEEVE